MDFGDDQFLADFDAEAERHVIIGGHRQTQQNEHVQHGMANFQSPMGNQLPQQISGTHHFVPDTKNGRHSPGGHYGQPAVPFGAIMPNADAGPWRAGTTTPDSTGVQFQGLTLQSPAHSTGIGVSPFENNGSAEVMGMVPQPHSAPGMVMAPALHTVASADGSPFVTTPQSHSPPLMNMNMAQAAAIPMAGLQANHLQLAAIQAALQSQITLAIKQQQSMGATSPSQTVGGSMAMPIGAHSGNSTPSGGDRLLQHGNNLVLSSERDKLMASMRSGDGELQRSQRQQLQNKQAQARYRERQKAKVADMERTITELTRQVERVKELEEEAAALREAKASLSQELELRNRTVADLRTALQARGADVGAVTSAPNNDAQGLQRMPTDGGAVSGGVTTGVNDGSTSHSELSVSTGLAECQTQLQESVTKLQRFMESQQLAQAPVNATLGSSQTRQLGRHLEDVCTRQTRVLSAQFASSAHEDLCNMQLLALEQAAAARSLAPWRAVVDAAVVTPWQAQNVAALRAAYLHKLLGLYHDRQAMLSKVLAAAMPSQPGTVSPGGTLHPPPPCDSDAMDDGEELEAGAVHVAALRVNSMLFAVEQRTKVSASVLRLRENVASEVKVLADFNKVVLTCVLTPMQAARVIHQASSLALLTGVALANALHSLQDEDLATIPSHHQQAESPVTTADASDMRVEGSGESLPDVQGRVSPEMGKRTRDPVDAVATGPGRFHTSSPGPYSGTSPPPSPRRPSDANVAKFSRTSPQGPL